MRRIEDLFNKFSDIDWMWWPILSWRPPKDRPMTLTLVMKVTALFGTALAVFTFLLLFLLFAQRLSWTTCLAISWVYGWGWMFCCMEFPYAFFWNRRARRLAGSKGK